MTPQLKNKYRQLEYKISKVWDYYRNNRTSLKYKKSGILWDKIWNILYNKIIKKAK